MPNLEFVGQSVRDDDSRGINTARLVNCYREPTENGWILKSVRATELIATTDQVWVTASTVVNEIAYWAIGNKIFRMAEDGTMEFVSNIGNVGFDSNTLISGNNKYLVICSNGFYQVVDIDTDTPVVAQTGAFANVGSVAFLGQRTFSSERNGRRFQWSDVVKPQTINGLSFATAETKDDIIVRLAAVNGFLWLFGSRSVERWYQTNAANVVLPVVGGTMEIGIKSFQAYTESPNGALFVGSDNKVYQINGTDAQPISTVGVETAITNGVIEACFYYQDEGHEFVCIAFRDRPAWCYDISTGEWHERAQDLDSPWTIRATLMAYNRFYGGDTLGNVVAFGSSLVDHTGPLIRRAISRTLTQEGRSFIVPKIEVATEVGDTRPGQPNVQTVLSLRLSQDRGFTWGPPKDKQLGVQGAYATRVIWRALGRFHSTMTAQLSWSDPINTPINTSLWIDLA